MNARHYDAILAGGGAAGLSLAYRLRNHRPDGSLLIVDEETKRHNDHTWCFWSKHESTFKPIIYRRWSQLAVIGENCRFTFDLTPYHYSMVRSVDFYRLIRWELADQPGVDFKLGTVERVVDHPDRAEVLGHELTYEGD